MRRWLQAGFAWGILACFLHSAILIVDMQFFGRQLTSHFPSFGWTIYLAIFVLTVGPGTLSTVLLYSSMAPLTEMLGNEMTMIMYTGVFFFANCTGWAMIFGVSRPVYRKLRKWQQKVPPVPSPTVTVPVTTDNKP